MKIKRIIAVLMLGAILLTLCGNSVAETISKEENESMNTTESLNLTQEWDKTFPKSDKVDHSKVTFHNRYGITLAADLYIPKDAEGRLPAIAVCGPFGAVK